MMLYVNLILPFLLHFPSSFKSVHPLDTFVYTYTIQNYSMSITLFRIPDQNDGNYHHMTNILATGLYAFCVCVQLFVSLNLILTRSILCLTLYYLCCLITSITTAYNHHFFFIFYPLTEVVEYPFLALWRLFPYCLLYQSQLPINMAHQR